MQPTRLFSSAVARQVLDILRGTPLPNGMQDSPARSLAFKTGTSYGQRDAWAAGVQAGWTVVVWAGRPDGASSPGITGLHVAAPVMTRIMDTLPASPDTVGTPLRALAPLASSLQVLPEHEGPRVLSPPNGAVIESFGPDGAATPVGLEASGGAQPYRWMINNQPLATPPGLAASWQPDGPGFAHVAVVDALGRASSVTIQVH